MDKEQIIAMGRTYVDGSDAGILFFANALLSANRKQGADARPVAIYQIAFSDEDGWCDTYEKIYQSHPEHMRRIVYATRDAAPRVESIEDQPIAWGEYDTQIGKRRRLMMASVDKESGCRVRLYDHPERDAAPSDAQAVAEMCAKFAELYWTDHGAGKGVEDAC